MQFKIFISSVKREFAEERKLLAEYIRKDAILGRFFEVFLFEEVPAQERSASDVYLSEVDASDIYLGILGATYGHVDRKGVSATEREYERAGTGTEDMIAKCREWGVPRPSWTLEDGDDFRVIIPRHVQEVSRVERPQHLQETTRKDGVKLAEEKVGHTENHTENHTVFYAEFNSTELEECVK